MVRKYSVKSKSYRWLVQIFFNIIDLAGINAWILYKEITGEKNSGQQLQLADELAKDHHRFLQEERENVQGTSSGSCNNFAFVRIIKK